MRRTLGQRLALRIAAATAVGMIVVIATGFTFWALVERGPGGESAGHELDEQLGPAIAVAVAGIGLAVLAARWLTRRATARIDALVAAAARVGAADLAVRLPAATDGDELDELALAIDRMLARIRDQLGAQLRFAADASHELRTPLTAALTALEVARRRPRAPAEWEEAADRAIAELGRMSKLVDALLALARADAMAARAEVAPAPLADVIDRVIAPLAGHADVAIAVTCAGELTAAADAGGLEIALANLVANAIAHSPPGAEVSIVASRDGGEVRVDVIDRGPGVAPADRERIFEPFVRADAPRADRAAHGAGVGLGLAIAHRIVSARGGRIAVGDGPGGGARFTLWWPGPAPARR